MRFHFDLVDQDLRLDVQVAHAFYVFDFRLDAFGYLAQFVQVRAVDFDGDLCRDAGEEMAEQVRKRLLCRRRDARPPTLLANGSRNF